MWIGRQRVLLGEGLNVMKRRTKALVATAVAVPVALGGGAVGYAAYYQDRALPRSSVVDVAVGGMTRSQVSDAVQRRVDKASVEITSPAGSVTVPLNELGYVVDVAATADRVFDAKDSWNAYAQAPFRDDAIDVVSSVDEAAFEAFVDGLVADEVRVATNASVSLAKDKTSFSVTDGQAGLSPDTSTLAEAAAQAAATLTPASATVDLVEAEPQVTTTDATAVADRANALVEAAVTVTQGSRSFTATAAEKASWIRLPELDGDVSAADITVDRGAIAAWVADQVNISARDGSRHLSSTGKVVRVITEGRDGVKVSDPDAVAASLADSWLADSEASAEAKVSAINATWSERRLAPGAENLAYPATAGQKWIDVNLSRHTMTAYVGGTSVFGPVAMVDGAPETPTDVGTFTIYYKRSLMTMRGTNVDGTPYETEDVPWSSFFNGGEALHGAYWRNSFGYQGSHGCVNLPVDTAKWVYDWAPIGTVVRTHY